MTVLWDIDNEPDEAEIPIARNDRLKKGCGWHTDHQRAPARCNHRRAKCRVLSDAQAFSRMESESRSVP